VLAAKQPLRTDNLPPEINAVAAKQRKLKSRNNYVDARLSAT
jgi:hypothetical protein